MRAVNLIPAEQRSGARLGAGRSGGAAYVLLATVLGVAILAFLYGQARSDISSGEAEAAKVSAEARQASEEAERLAPYTQFVALQKQRLEDVQELVGTRFDWAHAMHELGRVLPRDVSLSSVSGTIGAAGSGAPVQYSIGTNMPIPSSTAASTPSAGTVSSATPPGSVPKFTIGGCTTTQSQAALTIDRLRLMNGVSEVTLQSSTRASSSGGNPCSDTFAMTVEYEGMPAPAIGAPSGPTAHTAANESGGAK